MTIEDVIAEKEAMDEFHAELDALMESLGYDLDAERAECGRIVGWKL